MIIKAHKKKLPVAEIPTIWVERHFGTSKFKLKKWIPKYMNWYLKAFLPSAIVLKK
jgi:hypothetical protein